MVLAPDSTKQTVCLRRWFGRLIGKRATPSVQQPATLEEGNDPARPAMAQGTCQSVLVSPGNDSRQAVGRKALGDACADRGDAEAAERCYREAVALDAGLAPAWNNLGLLLRATGRAREAEAAFRRAVETAPGLTVASLNLADLLEADGQAEAAEAILEAARHNDPADVRILINLAALCVASGDPALAEAHARAALRIDPANSLALYNLALALRALGDSVGATAVFDRALEATPEDAGIASARLLTLQYRDDVAAEWLAREHLAFGDRFPAPPSAPRPAPLERRRLRLGYVSADFCTHVASMFLEPVLKAHDPDVVEVFCYHAGGREDAQTERLRQWAQHWRTIVALGDDEAAALIRADGLDVCIDLSGHTGGNRLPLLARRVAPVQATWLGYPGGTGVSTMDARFTDAFADPPSLPGKAEWERLVRLVAGFLCFPAIPEAPPVAALPVMSGARFTFGCFNNLAKASDTVLRLWVRVLEAVPDARLLLKARGLDAATTAARVQERFAAAGGDPARLALEGATPDYHSHLARYAAVDVALDSFPYHGTTTTCEALWMGVPVVTLAGDRHAARVGASLLSRAGLPHCVAADAESFVAIASGLANDRAGLARLRAGLRNQIVDSPLADAVGFTRALENACRELVLAC